MYGIKYNNIAFEVSKKTQQEAIRNAQKIWDIKEIEDSLKTDYLFTKIVLRHEQGKDNQNLEVARIEIASKNIPNPDSIILVQSNKTKINFS